ncbi:hypothetical protein HY970_02935 [Candidatus Kaiserbacteria bacterium]|nr:hypothetical protein [Candidatus Kaiserbacteria bacterium]
MEQAASQVVGRLVDLVLNPIILVLFAAGFFLFMWGLVQFLWGLRSGEVGDSGKQHMLWGIVGMLIMVSVYGILRIINDTLDLNAQNPDVSRLNDVGKPFNFTGK